MPLVPIPYANLVFALLTIAIGILREPHFVSKSSIWVNVAFFVATWATTPISTEFTALLILYLAIAYVVVRREKGQEGVEEKRRRNTIAFIFLGSRGYGSMLLSMALFELGLLQWLGNIPVVSSLAALGFLGCVLGGWLMILALVHIVGTIVKGPP
jgi:hypothetical protein